jgi:hypothetical protein
VAVCVVGNLATIEDKIQMPARSNGKAYLGTLTIYIYYCAQSYAVLLSTVRLKAFSYWYLTFLHENLIKFLAGRGLERDDLTNSALMSPNAAGRGGVAGSQPMSRYSFT